MNEQASPDQRADATQANTALVDDGVGRRRRSGISQSWLALLLLTRALFSSDNPLPGCLAAWLPGCLAEDTKVGERTARQYVAHLQRFHGWLAERYQAPLLEATTRDLRQYKTDLGKRQKPASVNAAVAALRRFYGWAAGTGRVARTPPST